MKLTSRFKFTISSLFVFLLVIQSSLALRWSGDQLYDLEGTTLDFIAQANVWSASRLVSGQKYYDCGGTYLLGGYNILGKTGANFAIGDYFENQYTSLPSHNMIVVNLIFFKIDSWDLGDNDYAEFKFDGISFSSWVLPSGGSYEVALCGSPTAPNWKEYPNIKTLMSFPHTDSSVTMRVISHLTQDTTDESFGIREINMVFINSPTTPTASFCGVSSNALPDRVCPCSLYNQFKPTTGSCQLCHSSCATCSGSNSNNCLTCPVNKYMNTLNECVDCAAPCATCQSTYQYCVTCQSGWYLLSDHTCLQGCDYPLIQSSPSGVDSCSSPCASNQVVFPDRSCHTACDPLLQEQTVGPFKICKVPCSSNQVLYYNGNCLPSCDLPFSLISYGSYDVCDYICVGNDYLYPEGTCKAACNQPYKPVVKGGKRFCELYCDSTQYFFPPTLGCLTACPDHYYAEQSTNICKECSNAHCLQCPTNAGQKCTKCQDTVLDIDGSCKVCSSMKITYIGTLDNNGHQYKIQLSPYSCNLDLQTVIANLLPTDDTKALFPKFSLKIQKTSSTVFSMDIIFESSVLKQGDLKMTLAYLSGTASVPKTLVPDAAIQKLAEYAPAAGSVMTGVTSAGIGGAFAFGAMAVMWPLINFQQFIGYFVYINVNYPLQTELFFSLFSFANFDFLPNPLATYTEDLADDILQGQDTDLLQTHQAPIKFRKRDETSFYIENNASNFLANIALLLLLAFTSLIVRFCRMKVPFARTIHSTLKWNLILRSFLENGIPISLASLLQLRKLSFDNAYTIICGLLALSSFVYILLMTIFAIQIISEINSEKRRMKYVIQQYGTLYENTANENDTAKYYHIFLLLRGFLLIFLIVFLESYPFLQTIPLIIVNIFLVFILFKYNIFEKTSQNYINRLKEIFITAAEICILLLAFEVESERYSQALGWTIIGTLGIAMLIELGYILINQVRELKAWFRKMKLLSQVFIFESYGKWKTKKLKLSKIKKRAIADLTTRQALRYTQREETQPSTKG